MPPKEPDKVQREIEELLDKLDNFVPEERLVSKIRSRRKVESGPGMLDRLWARVGKLTLGHVMVAGLALLLIGTFARGALGAFATPVVVTGIVLTVGAFILSAVNRDSRRTLAGGSMEKRWRGQVVDYSEPSPTSRFREWLRGRRHR
ncbi:MAG: hypothetical protein M3P30_07975 [Chloroflexota bacterium]|nr:hypothetical protein [Chloroflexota bacterium]